MDPKKQQNQAFPKFLIVYSENNALKTTSPIIIHKTIVSTIGEPKFMKKLNNGSLLVEINNFKQAEQLLKLEKIANINVKVSPHRTLNHSKGVISESELQRDLEEDLLECLTDQNVIAVKRINIKKNGQNFPTKHLIITFNTPTLPKSIKIAYLNCPVKHFIPNPLRCFKCQRFGHSITACRSKQICARCSSPDHDSNSCSITTPKCYNCNGEHPAYFRSCPRYQLEKEIQTIKITKNISFQEARKIVNDRTPQPGISYSAALNSSPQNKITSNETVTIKKSDWLALLAIKKSFEENSSSINKSPKSTKQIGSPKSQTIINCTTISNNDSHSTVPSSSGTNTLNITAVTNKPLLDSNTSQTISHTKKQNPKSTREQKKQEKKSSELEISKKLKSTRKDKILSTKRNKDILKTNVKIDAIKEDFLKDSLKKSVVEEDSDSLIKVYATDDEMSTSEIEDLPPSP